VLELNTFIFGSELKFAEAFINKLNARLAGDEVQMNLVGHHCWDTNPNKGGLPSVKTDLILILKSNISHRLRDAAIHYATTSDTLWIECVHKVAVAEKDIRKMLSLPISQVNHEEDDKSLEEMWDEITQQHGWHLPLPHKWGIGIKLSESLPYVLGSKRSLVAKWDKIYFSLVKKVILKHDPNRDHGSLPSVSVSSFLEREWASNAGRSGYYTMLALFQKVSKDPTSLAYENLVSLAESWTFTSGVHLKKKALDFALDTIFGLKSSDLPSIAALESRRVSNTQGDTPETEHDLPKTEQDAPAEIDVDAPAVEEDAPKTEEDTPKTEEDAPKTEEDTPAEIEHDLPATPAVIEKETLVEDMPLIPKVETTTPKDYVLLGSFKITPATAPIHLTLVQVDFSEVSVHGSVELSIGKVDTLCLHNVTIRK